MKPKISHFCTMALPLSALQHLSSGAALLADAAPAVARILQLEALRRGTTELQPLQCLCCMACGTLFRSPRDVSSVEILQGSRSGLRRRRRKIAAAGGTAESSHGFDHKHRGGAAWFVVIQCQVCNQKLWRICKSEQAAHAARYVFVRRPSQPQRRDNPTAFDAKSPVCEL